VLTAFNLLEYPSSSRRIKKSIDVLINIDILKCIQICIYGMNPIKHVTQNNLYYILRITPHWENGNENSNLIDA